MFQIGNINLRKSLLEAKLPFKNYLVAAIITNFLVVALVLLIRPALPPQVPLYYGMAEGEGQLGTAWQLIIPNLVALTIVLVNTAVSRFIKDEFLAKTLIVGAIAASFLATITVMKIIFLIGSF
jgi:hypothetical protein